MDIIGNLSSQLGLDPKNAQALVGSLLGGVQEQVKQNVGGAEASEFASAIPELGNWQNIAKEVLGGDDVKETGSDGLFGLLGGGGAGGLLGAAASMLGGQKAGGFDIGQLIGLLGKFDLNADNASNIGEQIVEFLKERLSAALMETLAEKNSNAQRLHR